MGVIKRKILLESLMDWGDGLNYNNITATTININIFLTQTIKNMGMFTDVENEDQPIEQPLSLGGAPNLNNVLIEKLLSSGITFDFMHNNYYVTPPSTVNDYYDYGDRISALTSSRLVELKKYDADDPYEEMFLVDIGSYYDYRGELIPNSVSTIFDLNTPNYTGYTFDANNDNHLGTLNQTTGIMFRDIGETSSSYDDEINTTLTKKMAYHSYIGQGWNETNISLSANVKEEKYLGVTALPEVESEVFIERGAESILEPHLRLSEIENLNHLENYNNSSYYNVKKQTL